MSVSKTTVKLPKTQLKIQIYALLGSFHTLQSHAMGCLIT